MFLSVLWCGPAIAVPVLRDADVAIVFSTPTSCEVTLRVQVTGADQVEHRLELLEGTRADLVEVLGGVVGDHVLDIGRTRKIDVRPDGIADGYALRYRVEVPATRPHRCPVWLPAAAADGRSRNVRLAITVPDGVTPSASMPAVAWTGTRGSVTLGHLPAFVLAPWVAAGERPSWDVSRVMDVSAIAVLVGASLVWLQRQKGRR